MALKKLFFQKTTKNRPTDWGFAPRPPKPPVDGGPHPQTPVCDTFELHQLSQHASKVKYLRFSAISLSPLSLQNPGYVPTGNDFRSSILRYLCQTKTSSLEKF